MPLNCCNLPLKKLSIFAVLSQAYKRGSVVLRPLLHALHFPATAPLPGLMERAPLVSNQTIQAACLTQRHVLLPLSQLQAAPILRPTRCHSCRSPCCTARAHFICCRHPTWWLSFWCCRPDSCRSALAAASRLQVCEHACARCVGIRALQCKDAFLCACNLPPLSCVRWEGAVSVGGMLCLLWYTSWFSALSSGQQSRAEQHMLCGCWCMPFKFHLAGTAPRMPPRRRTHLYITRYTDTTLAPPL